LIART
jgi:hypothetical protein